MLSKKELIYLKVYNLMFACVETIEHYCSLEIKYKWMLLSIANIKREYNIRDCEPIIHCKSGSWFRFPKNLFHIYVYHNGKIFWKSYAIVFKTDDPSWHVMKTAYIWFCDLFICCFTSIRNLYYFFAILYPLKYNKNILWKRLSAFIHI